MRGKVLWKDRQVQGPGGPPERTGSLLQPGWTGTGLAHMRRARWTLGQHCARCSLQGSLVQTTLSVQQGPSHKTNKSLLPGRKHTQMSPVTIFGPFPVFLLVSGGVCTRVL